jgi:hypothetical protein
MNRPGFSGGITVKNLDSPNETRTPDKTTMAVLDLDGVKAARITFEQATLPDHLQVVGA